MDGVTTSQSHTNCCQGGGVARPVEFFNEAYLKMFRYKIYEILTTLKRKERNRNRIRLSASSNG